LRARAWRGTRALDKIAARYGVTPLSSFASGDDLVVGEELHWFAPEDALRTAERLLEADVTESLPVGVAADLERLRDALRPASAAGVRFCLLVREGSLASGHQMGVRKGSFFLTARGLGRVVRRGAVDPAPRSWLRSTRRPPCGRRDGLRRVR
jgi:hypothetical protein